MSDARDQKGAPRLLSHLSHCAVFALLCALTACGSGGGGGTPDAGTPDGSTVSDGPPPAMPALRIAAPATVTSYTCAKFTVSALAANGQPASIAAATSVTLGGLGSARAFSTLSDCRIGMATTTLTLGPSPATSVDFYLRDSAAETLTLKATATGFVPGTAAVTTVLFQVLGQPDTATVTNVELGEWIPSAATVVAGKLLVVDGFSNRVLIWNQIPTSSDISPDLVLGQPDLSSVSVNFGGGAAQTPSARGMHDPVSVASDGTHLFISEYYNHRILAWKTFPTQSDQPADFALGQPAGAANLTSNTLNNGGVSATSLNFPRGVLISGQKLYVVDYGNHRVLVWNTIPTAPVAADFALGQPAGAANLTTNTRGASATVMANPSGVWVQGKQLFVAEYGNHRVLVWNTIPTAPVAADFALGQPAGATNLTANTKNNGGLSASGMNNPHDVFSDGTRLFVSDTGNNRVLVWRSLPTTAVAADYVLGQPNFTSATQTTTAAGMNLPSSVFSDGTRLFVADAFNSRTLVFATVPTTSGAAATYALGQPSGSANLTSGQSYNGPVSAALMQYPTQFFSDGTHFFVADTGNNRVLGWKSMPASNAQPADFALGQSVGSANLTDSASPSPPSDASMAFPNSLVTDGKHLFVADTSNNRVLVWNTIPTTSVPADFALGQPAGAGNLTANTANNGGLTGASMSGPLGVATDGTRLFVADTANNRVLVWNAIPAAPVAANLALGQPAGASNLQVGTANNGGVSASSMNQPNLIFSDGKSLFVADTNNHRVLIWTPIPTTPSSASLVVGQPDFTHNTAGATAQALNYPEHAISDGTHLFVADTGNNRVLIWNAMPTGNGQAASAVVGQPDLVSAAVNADGPVTDKVLSAPQGLWADATRLFIADNSNSRVLIVPTTAP